jgi:hypothetical protein
MARRLGKGYLPNDIRTATFKLSHEKWERFQSLCRAQNRSASDVLLEFVESILNDESIPAKDDGVALAISNLEKQLAAINSRLDALESKDDGLPSVVEAEPSQGIIEGEENISEKISQREPSNPEPVEAADLLKKFEDGKLYSQTELAQKLTYPGRKADVGSIQVGQWIREGKATKDPIIKPLLPHFSYSHTDKSGQPVFYRFSLTPEKNNPS